MRALILFFSLVIVAPIDSQGQTQNDTNDNVRVKDSKKLELIQRRFPNGAIQFEHHLVEDKSGNLVNHGQFIEYNLKNEVIRSGQFVVGKKTGSWSKLIDESKLQKLVPDLDKGFKRPFHSKADFRDGLLDGSWVCHDSNGNIVFQWEFKNGKRNGDSIWLDSKGKPLVSISYKSDLADGPAILDPKLNSKQHEMVEFAAGRKKQTVEKFYSDKSRKIVKSRVDYLIHSKINLAKHDWENSSVTYRATADQTPVMHGLAITYHANGQTESRGKYLEGKKHGEFVWWYENGQKKSAGSYQNGKEDGRWNWWHENGIPKARGSYRLGAQIGQWSTWNESGKLDCREDVAKSKSQPKVR